MLETILQAFGLFVLAYFFVLNLIYLGFTLVAWRSISEHVRKRGYDSTAEAFASPLTPAVSVLLPAYNEEPGVVESVNSLVSLRYPVHEVIVVNDGSTDGTMAALTDEFDLVEVRRPIRDSIQTKRVRGIYVSRRDRDLWVIDKENGGKADALNCGVNAAHFSYVCAVDADAVIEHDALLHVAKPIMDDPHLVAATGGIVRVANGCRVEHGEVLEVGLPKNRLAIFQVVEYFRAFLVGRVGWTKFNSLLIISGAFGLFKRSLVEEIGGYWTETAGEDVELVVRMHRHLRTLNVPYRIVFVPDPVCWTECPEDLKALSSQRRRWHRGLLETLWRHRSMTFRPRYGTFGLLGLPYFLLFEALGPLIEILGYLLFPIAYLTGHLSASYLLAFLGLALVLGICLSVAALVLEEFGFRRHTRRRDVATLFMYGVLENLGYRQLTTFWRALSFVDLLRGKSSWGEMTRKGLARGGRS